MTMTFEPTKKPGRHIYQVFGKVKVWRHPDGRAASETESCAMAQGYIPGHTEPVEVRLTLIETGRDSERAIWKAWQTWCMTAMPWEYGGEAVWQEYEIRRSHT